MLLATLFILSQTLHLERLPVTVNFARIFTSINTP